MAVQASYPVVALGAWTQICEKREGRQSLMVQLIGGSAILGFSTNAPTTPSDFGVVPCGVWHSLTSGNGPATFRLSRALDGDLVEQAWFAWVVPLASPSALIVFFIGAGQTWIVPAGLTQLENAYLWGCGGNGGPDDGVTAGGGGGGGAFVTSGPLTVVPGTIWTINVDGQPGAFGSTSLVDPGAVVVAQATSGSNGGIGLGGAGGAGTIGALQLPGGNGSSPPIGPGEGGGGGGAAGTFTAGFTGAGKTAGAGGGTPTFAWPTPAAPMLTGEGGGGGEGGNVGLVGATAFYPGGGTGGGGVGSGGGIEFGNNGALVMLPQGWSLLPRMAVFEAFLTPALDDPNHVVPGTTFSVQLPRLDAAGVAALRSLQAKLSQP